VCKSLVVDNLCRVDSNDEDGTIRSLMMILPQYLSFASIPVIFMAAQAASETVFVLHGVYCSFS
jgi:hypothetical protein